jgi:hypothetical protein
MRFKWLTFENRNVVVTLDYHHDEVAFADAARTMIRKYALKSRREWRAEILEHLARY